MVQNVRVQGNCSGGGAALTATFLISLLAAVLAALAFSHSAAAVVDEGIASPAISSDKADYAPGELVTLRGSDWRAVVLADALTDRLRSPADVEHGLIRKPVTREACGERAPRRRLPVDRNRPEQEQVR